MPEEPTKPKSSVIKILLLVLITIIVLVGLYQWAVHQGDKSKQRFMQKLELGDLMNAEAAKPEPPPAKAPDISIHDAAYEGNVEAVKEAIATGADVNAKDEVGWTPLHWAAIESHKEIVELLIANGANMNAKIEVGKWKDQTPLSLAIQSNHTEIADLLREHGGQTGAELEAAGKPTEPVAEAATPEPTAAKASDISIHYAALNGNIEAVKQHLADGADVNAKDEKSATPLYWAATQNLLHIGELLIANGADVDVKADGGGTPLYLAAILGHMEITYLLIANGADVNAIADNGKTPLDHATNPDNPRASARMAALLRKHGGKTRKELEAAGN